MSCTTEMMTIIKGDAIDYDIRFVTEDRYGIQTSFDLTGYTVKVYHPGQSSPVEIDATITEATEGSCKVEGDSTKSEALRRGDRQTIYAVLKETATSKEKTLKFEDVLYVEERNFK